jgi:hypothetical protein
MGVAAMAFSGWMAERIYQMNRRWGRWAKWTPEPRAMRITYLVIGALMIGIGMVALLGILK